MLADPLACTFNSGNISVAATSHFVITNIQQLATTVEKRLHQFSNDFFDIRYSLDEIMKLKEEVWFSRGVALAPICNKHIVDAILEKLEELRQSGTPHQLIAVACSIMREIFALLTASSRSWKLWRSEYTVCLLVGNRLLSFR